MTQPNIYLLSQKKQLPYIDLSDVVEALDVILIEGQSLDVRLVIVKAFPDATHASNTNRSKAEDVGEAEIVDVWCHPATVVELPQV